MRKLIDIGNKFITILLVRGVFLTKLGCQNGFFRYNSFKYSKNGKDKQY